jgi:hypothetical protein
MGSRKTRSRSILIAVLLVCAVSPSSAGTGHSAFARSGHGHGRKAPLAPALPGPLHAPIQWRTPGRRFYVDPRRGDDANDGRDPERAWRSLQRLQVAALNPGDTVALHRGGIFTGAATLADSGTHRRPITLTAYGRGPAPLLTNAGGLNMLYVSADHLRIANLRFSGGVTFDGGVETGFTPQNYEASGAVAIVPGADDVSVVNDKFDAVGVGVKTYGLGTRVIHNKFRDLTIAFRGTTRAGIETSYGAIGVSLNNSDAEVGWNSFSNCRSLDSPYGADGGAIEIEGTAYPKDGISIHHNFSAGSQGFLEVAETSSSNVEIAYNVSDDYQQFIAFDTTTSPHDYRVLHNTVLRRSPLNATAAFAVFHFRDPGPEPSGDWLSIRDNVFSLPATTALGGSYSYKPFDFPHDHNVFAGLADPVGYPLGEGDVIADPRFAASPYAQFGFVHSPRAVRLHRHSPAINRATTRPEPVDILGHPVRRLRPDAGAVDAGRVHRRHRHRHHDHG